MMRDGFALLEALIALLITALILVPILSAQILIAGAENRIRTEFCLRNTGNYLLMTAFLAQKPDLDTFSHSIVVTNQTASLENWIKWDIYSEEQPSRRLVLFFEGKSP